MALGQNSARAKRRIAYAGVRAVYPNPEIYDFVSSSPPMRSAELAQRFGITIKHASAILFQHGKILREKTITEIAKELPAPMTSREFAQMHNCHISTAYEALKAAHKLIKSKNLHRPPQTKSSTGQTNSRAANHYPQNRHAPNCHAAQPLGRQTTGGDQLGR